MHERNRLNPKDVYTPDDFLRDRRLDYEQLQSREINHAFYGDDRPPVSHDMIRGVLLGVVIMVPVWMLVVAIVWWWLS